jgi:hypothetical protein
VRSWRVDLSVVPPQLRPHHVGSAMPNSHQKPQGRQLDCASGHVPLFKGVRQSRDVETTCVSTRGGLEPRGGSLLLLEWFKRHRALRGTITGCGGLRNGWARPAKRVPAQPSLLPPNHIVPSPPLSGTEGVLAPIANAGVSGRWATAQTDSKSHRRPTVPYHFPIIGATAFSMAPRHDVRGGRFATEKRIRVLLPIGGRLH